MNAIDKAASQCQTAVLNNSSCFMCKKHKSCEEYGSWLTWKRVNKQ